MINSIVQKQHTSSNYFLMLELTTDSEKYFARIKEHLTERFDADWSPEWNYCEMTQLLHYAYSLTFLRQKGSANSKVLYKNWIIDIKAEHRLGIYNLDSIRTHEEEIHLPISKSLEILEMLKNKSISTLKLEGIVLDGYFNQLTNFKQNKKLNWNLDEEMNDSLSLLIQEIRKLKSPI